MEGQEFMMRSKSVPGGKRSIGSTTKGVRQMGNSVKGVRRMGHSDNVVSKSAPTFMY
jgi:hypothetical protein